MQYWTLRRWLPRFGGLYVVAALFATAAPGFEVFPFFCWFLFPVVPGFEPRYELVVEVVEGESIDPRTDFQRLGRIKDPMAMDLWLATQRLGQALDRNDGEAVNRERALIEDNFICAPRRYGIDKVEYDPLERWQTDEVKARRTLQVWTSSTSGCRSSPWAG